MPESKKPEFYPSSAVWDETVAFLRKWLPEDAKCLYREMVRENPSGWWHDPHFANGLIPDNALRGNGLTEKTLGVKSLDLIWPLLLLAALSELPEDGSL